MAAASHISPVSCATTPSRSGARSRAAASARAGATAFRLGLKAPPASGRLGGDGAAPPSLLALLALLALALSSQLRIFSPQLPQSANQLAD